MAEAEVALEAEEEILEEMGPYLAGNGEEASVCQTLGTVATEVAEGEVEVATDWVLSAPRLFEAQSSIQRHHL